MMYKTVLIPLLCLFSLSIFAQKATVYRWVDDNNVVHYSHEHPTDKDYTQVNVKVAYAPITDKQNDNQAALNAQYADSKSKQLTDEQLAINEQTAQKNCDIATKNISVLSSLDNVSYTTDSGEAKLLTEEEKMQQLEISKEQQELYCNYNSNN